MRNHNVVRPPRKIAGRVSPGVFLCALEGILVGCGVVNVFLEVEENNISAVKLYEGAGYAHTGRRKNYYQNEAGRRDALLYHRSLLVVG